MTAISLMRHTEKAVTALATYLGDATHGFVAQLRAIETTLGLASSSLPDPVDIVASRIPRDDVSPLVQVYEESWIWPGPHREKILNVDCTILVCYASDVNLEDAETLMRRYVVAIAQVLEYDSTLGGNVVGAALTNGDASRSVGDQSSTRHVWAQGVTVQVSSP